MAAETGSRRPAYRRIVLKLSGEALAGSQGYGLDPSILGRIGAEVREVTALDVQLAIVIGGGNIFRGVAASAGGMDRATADYMGMLATIINALALQDALEKAGCETRVLSAIEMRAVEIEAEVVLKATKVDGVYDADPATNPKAKRFTRLDYLDLINKDLRVMDHTAVTLCRENNIPIIVFDLGHEGNLEGVVAGKPIGTYVGAPA